MGLQEVVFFVVVSKFYVMTRSKKEKQSYKLGHNRLINRTSRFKDLSIKNKWHVHNHSRAFHVSRYRSKYTISDNSYKTFRIRIVSIFPSALS